MKWTYLILALIFENIGFIALKYSNGFTKAWPVMWTIVFDLLALWMFIISLKKFETSFVYMIAAGVGTAMVVISNYLVFKQPLNWIQIISIILIIVGTVGIQSQNTML
jgi:multidrug transporter EmrE-like cation transporter